jgi:hypothetical protein
MPRQGVWRMAPSRAPRVVILEGVRRRLAPLCAAGLLAACADEVPMPKSSIGVGGLGAVELVGERAGLLVWHPMDGATRYEVELLGTGGAIVQILDAAGDTILTLPPAFVPGDESAWRVRAYDEDRTVGVSGARRLY